MWIYKCVYLFFSALPQVCILSDTHVLHIQLSLSFLSCLADAPAEPMCIFRLVPAAVKAQSSSQELHSAHNTAQAACKPLPQHACSFLVLKRRAEKCLERVVKVSLEQQKSHLQKKSFNHNTACCAGLFSSRPEVIDYCVFDWQNQTMTRSLDPRIQPACFCTGPHFKDTRATGSRKGQKLAKIKKVVSKVM